MMAANYRHIGGGVNRLGRHYSRFSGFWPMASVVDQSLALRKSQNRESNRRRRASGNAKGTLGIAGRGGGGASGNERQAGGPDADVARTGERRPASAGVFAVHRDARFDQARTCYG